MNATTQPIVHLNLARKWRSKQFHEIVGQELPVRMLQNSLYINHIFPVYLFSGQRGCGKTTTARIFAGALNCQNLSAFQQNPKEQKLPCLQCASCQAMSVGQHPDFIEIDAASHTGVDNVRNIIDAASLLPIMGTRRIYLIDEAHMLSKAAFNAFLKILEEPPASVVFMLATTDPLKIVETVRSRCFQLFFTALETTALVDHLEHVCSAENIPAQRAALQTIVQETEGSARDALNLLEQVRFAHPEVTQTAVDSVLGYLPETVLLDLFENITVHNTAQTLAVLQSLETYNCTPLIVWKKLQELIQTLLLCNANVPATRHYSDMERVQKLAHIHTTASLLYCLQILYDHEMVLIKSTAQSGILNLMVLTMLQPTQQRPTIEPVLPDIQPTISKASNTPTPPVVTENVVSQSSAPTDNNSHDTVWKTFVQKISTLSDPLLHSIFQQGSYRNLDTGTHTVTLVFAKETEFFHDWLTTTQTIWQPLINEIFGATMQCTITFETKAASSLESTPRPVSATRSLPTTQNSMTATVKTAAQPTKQNYTASNSRAKQPTLAQEMPGKPIDISDKEQWATTHALLDAFGGKVVEIQPSEPSKQEQYDIVT